MRKQIENNTCVQTYRGIHFQSLELCIEISTTLRTYDAKEQFSYAKFKIEFFETRIFRSYFQLANVDFQTSISGLFSNFSLKLSIVHDESSLNKH